MKILFFLGIHLLLLSFLANGNINGFVHSFEAKSFTNKAHNFIRGIMTQQKRQNDKDFG
jgi:hypothetical protein